MGISGPTRAVCGWVLFLLVSVLASPTRAQEPPTFNLPEVVVPGKRPQPGATTPAYVTVIPRDELQRMGFLTLGDALQFVSEVYIRIAGSGPGGLQQASIRGSSPLQVLVLIDGVPLNATAQFGVNLSTIALADVERVEVLRGPYSAIYGSGALGGVIQVITRGDARRLASARVGSYSTVQSELRLGGASSAGAFRLGTSYLGTAGDRPNSDLARWTTNAQVVSNLGSSQSLTLAVHRTFAQSGVPPQDRLNDGRTILSVTWTQQPSSPSRQQGRLWWLGDALHFESPSFSSVSDSEGSAFGAEWQSVVQLLFGTELTWGIEWQQARFRSMSASTFGTSGFQAEGSSGAGYVQYDVILAEKTFVGIGTRYDYHSVYGGQLNPRLGIVHFLTPELRLRASIGRTFRGPTFGELFFPGSPTCPGSNPNLKPERAWSGDLGLEAAVTSALLVRFNGFYTDAMDLIVGGCNPQNVGSARVAGFSLETVGRFNDRWVVNANLTWSDGIDRSTGLPLLRLPPLQANIVLRYLPGQDTALSVVASYVSDRPDVDFSTCPVSCPSRVTVPGYVSFGLRAEQNFGTLVLRAGVDNLFDARFETLKGFPGPTRTFFVQVGSEF